MSKEVFDYFAEDARLVQEESELQLEAQKNFLAREDALTELDRYFMSMSVEEVEVALAGLREYAEHFRDDLDIEIGWHKNVQS